MRPRFLPIALIFALVCSLCSFKAHAWTYQKPACWPDAITDIRWRHYDTIIVVLWYCDTPTWIVRYRYAFDTSKSNPSVHITGKTDAELAALHAKVINRDLTLTEQDILDKLEAEQGIKITVAPNGSSTTRPVYAATATNRRSTDPVARIDIRDKDGKPTPCGRKRLQNADGTGSMYFEVQGGYTLCKIVGPISK